jgi:hypothetical protein
VPSRSEVGVKHEYKYTYNVVKRNYSSIYVYIYITEVMQEKRIQICLYIYM